MFLPFIVVSWLENSVALEGDGLLPPLNAA